VVNCIVAPSIKFYGCVSPPCKGPTIWCILQALSPSHENNSDRKTNTCT